MTEDERFLLSAVVEHPLASAAEREAFADMLERGWPLSEKQRTWLSAVATRLGIQPSENLFSNWDEKRRKEERARAAKIVLPHEQPGYQKPQPIRRREEEE